MAKNNNNNNNNNNKNKNTDKRDSSTTSRVPVGWDGKWKNGYYWQWEHRREWCLKYSRDNGWKKAYRDRKHKLEWYLLLIENSYDITFDHLIPFQTPIIRFLKDSQWLYQMVEKDGKYVYSFDPLYMDEEKEKEFRERLTYLINTKNIKLYV